MRNPVFNTVLHRLPPTCPGARTRARPLDVQVLFLGLLSGLVAGCTSYKLPENAPRAELRASISGLSGRHYGGQINVVVPECGDKAWWPKELFSNQGYSNTTRPRGAIAIEAGRPIVLQYSHAYPLDSMLNAVCGGQMIVRLEENGSYEASGSMIPLLNAKRNEPAAVCSFTLIDKRTSQPVPRTTLQCGATAPYLSGTKHLNLLRIVESDRSWKRSTPERCRWMRSTSGVDER